MNSLDFIIIVLYIGHCTVSTSFTLIYLLQVKEGMVGNIFHSIEMQAELENALRYFNENSYVSSVSPAEWNSENIIYLLKGDSMKKRGNFQAVFY